MKKTALFIISFILVISLCACGFNFDLGGFVDNDEPLTRYDTEEAETNGGNEAPATNAGENTSLIDIGGLLNSEWPENEYTNQVPKPDMKLLHSKTDEDGFTAAFNNASADQIKAYAEKLKSAGFTEDVEVEDNEVMGMTIYSFSALNSSGYSVTLTFAVGSAGMTISK